MRWCEVYQKYAVNDLCGSQIRSDKWNSGDNIIIMDVVTPFGGLEKVVEELNNTVFKGGKMFTVADLMGEGQAEGFEGEQ